MEKKELEEGGKALSESPNGDVSAGSKRKAPGGSASKSKKPKGESAPAVKDVNADDDEDDYGEDDG
jgi:hypothetical protein